MTAENIPDYPKRNPFPRNTVVAREGETLPEIDPASGLLRTCPTPALDEAKKTLLAYLQEYAGEEKRAREEKYAREDESIGTALGLRGEHGTGKTHLLRYLEQIAIGMTQQPDVSPQTKQIYVKADSSDFLDLFKRMMDQINLEELEAVNTRWLNRIAQSEAQKSVISRPAIAVLERDFSSVYYYLKNTLLSPDRIKGQQIEAINQITRHPDFASALSYIYSPELGEAARVWLAGDLVDNRTLSRLGIQERNLTFARARTTLILLISLYQRAGVPFVLLIDQIEKLLANAERKELEMNRSVLQTLSEVFGRERGFLCLAGTDAAWDLLSPDCDARIRRLDLSPLGLDEASNMLRVHLEPLQEFKPKSYADTPESDIYPFKKSAIPAMLRFSYGNTRDFLRLAHESFEDEEASPKQGPIDDRVVERTAQLLEQYFDKSTIKGAVERILIEEGIPFTEEKQLALAIPSAQEPVARLEVYTSVFGEDEAENAKHFVENVERILPNTANVKFILVVSGYVSQELKERLGEIAVVVSYKPKKFRHQFGEVVKKLKIWIDSARRPGANGAQGLQLERAMKEIEGLRGYLEELLESRQDETKGLDSRLQSFFEHQRSLESQRTATEIEDRRHKLRESEASRIVRARAEKEYAELAECESLRKEGENTRRQKALLKALLSTIFTMLLVMVGGLALSLLTLKGLSIGVILLLIAGIVVPVFVLQYFSAMGRIGPHSHIINIARGPVLDLRSLDEMAKRVAQSRRESAQSLMTLLRDPNSQVCYVAARVISASSTESFDPLALRNLARQKGWVRLKSALLDAIVKHAPKARTFGGEIFGSLLDYLVRDTPAESVYIIDTLYRLKAECDIAGELRQDQITQLQRQPIYLVVHALLNEVLDPQLFLDPDHATSHGPEVFIEEFAAAFASKTAKIRRKSDGVALYRLYRKTLQGPQDYINELSQLGLQSMEKSKIQDAIRVFGLGDSESLGYYDNLKKSSDYKEIYDFLFRVLEALDEIQLRQQVDSYSTDRASTSDR